MWYQNKYRSCFISRHLSEEIFLQARLKKKVAESREMERIANLSIINFNLFTPKLAKSLIIN